MGDRIPPVLRRLVAERAQGRCEYCLITANVTGFPHEVDHIVSKKHGGTDEPGNLAYCCTICNRYKGTDIATRGRSGEFVRLFHPRTDRWTDHFRIKGAVIEPLSRVGEVTATLLRMNRAERVVERRLLQALKQYPE